MIYQKLLFLFLSISSNYGTFAALSCSAIDTSPLASILFSASTLKIEGIVGGYPAWQSDFKYQAAILGKYNFTKVNYLVCSAGIISDYLLISAARCFVYVHNELRKLSFFAHVGEDVLTSAHVIEKGIDKIYTYNYKSFGNKQDLAIPKLKESLNLQNRLDLIPLDIPEISENFYREIGIVAGFGVSSINHITKQENRQQVRITKKTVLYLKSANVEIINYGESIRKKNDTEFGGTAYDIDAENLANLCGVIRPDEAYEHRGVCMGDVGAPLVVRNKVVGIVSKHRRDCDDTVHGTIYTKVSKFKKFINGIIEDKLIEDTTIYNNPFFTSNTKLINKKTPTN